MEDHETLRQRLNYTPVPSRFGTSGVRALVKDLTDLEIYCLTLGTLRYLEGIGKVHCSDVPAASLAIPLAGDLRPSTARILRAMVRAVRDCGYQVDYVGTIPTPALTFYALTRAVVSFVATGSHIPADRNGQKANRCDGEVLKSDEQGIVEAVEAAREKEYEQPGESSKFDDNGMLKVAQQVQLPPVNEKAKQLYRERYRQVFPVDGLVGKKVIFFEYVAVGRDLLPEILEDAGAQVIRVGRSDEFIPIDTEAISEAHLEMFSAFVTEQRQKHGRIDAVISTDGDSDRPLLVGVEEGAGKTFAGLRFFPGDLVGALVADYLGADAVAVPISVNPAVLEYFEKKGVFIQQTRIGSPFVIQAMRQALEKGYERAVSWEANGGFLLGSDIALGKSQLKALPTRDAALPILCVLFAAAENGLTLSQLFDRLPNWYGKADLIDNFPQKTSQRILRYFALADENIKSIEFTEDRLGLRDVNAQLVRELQPEDREAQQLLTKKRELEAIFAPDRGFDEIVRINTLDGIRCFFRNEDIAHLRPSGNAPQLRIYAHARTQARAAEIARMGVAEPDGILRSLERFIEGRGVN